MKYWNKRLERNLIPRWWNQQRDHSCQKIVISHQHLWHDKPCIYFDILHLKVSSLAKGYDMSTYAELMSTRKPNRRGCSEGSKYRNETWLTKNDALTFTYELSALQPTFTVSLKFIDETTLTTYGTSNNLKSCGIFIILLEILEKFLYPYTSTS